MGYTTDFAGRFQLNKTLAPEHMAYLLKFAETRHMRRNAEKVKLLPDPIRAAVNLEVGKEGDYFVGVDGCGDQFGDQDETILDNNNPPKEQPGLWCQWIPTEDGTEIEHDGGEKFYEYVPWIKYLVKHFLAPWGYKVNGKVKWQGEEMNDRGLIIVKNNVVKTENLE